jgi:uncharacterized ion transporter superfamily protein YfcC
MESQTGIRIGRKVFLQSLFILLALAVLAGMLTLVVPSGLYERTYQDGQTVILDNSFRYIPKPDYPAWRWLTAPFEVLVGPDNLILITIILFLLFIGGSFAILEKTGIVRTALARLVQIFGGRKYLLLWIVTLFFMALGAFFGIFEEVVPLVPLIIALAYYLGWDALTGLGMSILATNMGFSAAITNPFTIGVAQRLAGVPLFSGSAFRLLIFIVIYITLGLFLTHYARKIDRASAASPESQEDTTTGFSLDIDSQEQKRLGRAARWFILSLGVILVVLLAGPFISSLADYLLPVVGLLFFAAGIGTGLSAGLKGASLWKTALEGISGVLPAVPLILLAASVKHIVVSGAIMDTLVHLVSTSITLTSSYTGSLLVYGTALLLEWFIPSASAKAFLVIPLLLPIADLAGVTRQVAVTAYCFGDGFSNLVYPTNPVLLISLGLAAVSYPKWLRWSLGLWAIILVITFVFLGLAVAIGYGA